MSTKQLVALALLIIVLGLGAVVLAQSSAGFDLSWHVVAGGGGRAAGADYVVQGTMGQALAGPPAVTGGQFRVNSGFWYRAAQEVYLPLVLTR
jgi:hypothetical protein